MIERAEVSSSRSTLEVYESRWRKGLDGWDKTDADYLTPDDSSCSREVACHKVGWKPRIRQERLGLGIWGARHKHIFEQPKRRVPNGTHGVVRGRGLATPSYSIHKKNRTCQELLAVTLPNFTAILLLTTYAFCPIMQRPMCHRSQRPPVAHNQICE